MPVSSTITYGSGTVNPAATGTLTNVVTVTDPAGTIDPTPGNNSATDIDNLTPTADLSITKVDNIGGSSITGAQGTATPGGTLTYTIIVTNSGPSAVSGATVTDNFPTNLTGVTYTATATGGATGFLASGSGNISNTVNMPVDSTITYTVHATVNSQATGTLTNVATVADPPGTTDPTPVNNTATDVDAVAASADLSITKVDNVGGNRALRRAPERPSAAVRSRTRLSSPTLVPAASMYHGGRYAPRRADRRYVHCRRNRRGHGLYGQRFGQYR